MFEDYNFVLNGQFHIFFVTGICAMHCDFLIREMNQLLALEKEWKEIHQISLTKSPLSSFEFVTGWYSCFNGLGKICVYRVRSANQTIGFMPLIIYRNRAVRELCNLSEMEIGNPEPVVRHGWEKKFQELLLMQIVQTRHMWDIFCYNLSYTFSLFPGLFTESQLAKTELKWDKKTEPTYSIALNKSFEDYFQQDLGKKVRRNFNLSYNRLKKHGNYSYLHVAGRKAVQCWSLFLTLEGSGWKGSRDTAIIKIEDFKKRYYDLLLDTMASSGNLHMYFLKIGNKIVAGSFGYLDGDIYHEAKSAYDESYGFFSPSNLLRVYMVRDISTRFPEVKRIHMFPWDYGYKHRWTNEKSEYISTTIYSSSLRGGLAYSLKNIKQNAREKCPALYDCVKKIKYRVYKRVLKSKF